MELRFLGKEEIAEDTIEIRLAPREGGPFSFEAGQHVELVLQKPRFSDGRGASRLFSIVSAPHEEEIAIAFRRSESAFKKNLAQMLPDEPLSANGPFGIFTLPEDEMPVALIAGGIGITPFVSMVRDRAARGVSSPLVLLYANSHLRRAAYRDELARLADAQEGITFLEHEGTIDKEALAHIPRSEEMLYYAAGPPRMVAAARAALVQNGVSPGRVIAEEFTGY